MHTALYTQESINILLRSIGNCSERFRLIFHGASRFAPKAERALIAPNLLLFNVFAVCTVPGILFFLVPRQCLLQQFVMWICWHKISDFNCNALSIRGTSRELIYISYNFRTYYGIILSITDFYIYKLRLSHMTYKEIGVPINLNLYRLFNSVFLIEETYPKS